MKALVVKTDGEKSVVEFTRENSYATLKNAVDGWIECIYHKDRSIDIWINEEGKIFDLPMNMTGTILWTEMYGWTDVIVGDIIITGTADENGDTTGLTDEQIEALMSV